MSGYIACLQCDKEAACAKRRKLHPNYMTVYDVVFRNAWAKCNCPIYIALTAEDKDGEKENLY